MSDLRRFANENKFASCFRTSAKTGYNINEAMKYFIIKDQNKMINKKIILV